MSPFDLALRLTLLDLLLRPVGSPAMRPFTLAVAALGLLIPGFFRSKLVWTSLAFLTGLRVLLDWPLPDNHAYLLFYWCLAVFIALHTRDAGRCLALNGKLMIGFAFALAVLWKLLLSDDYADGRFFRIMMLTDYRFEWFTRLIGGLSAGEYRDMQQFVSQHFDGRMQFPSSDIPNQTSRFILVSQVLTYWTVFIEGAIADLFLLPKKLGLSRLRDALLVIFCVTTYSVATVDGFGWLLIALGVSQSEDERNGVRFAYLASFILLIFYGYLVKMY
ncbi:MAG TPA: hypothetical protein VHC46_06170 [Thermodesulfobacteriota bacterium]|nr:hypothetical protein [Thermodesulfobacteriota bacterium]